MPRLEKMSLALALRRGYRVDSTTRPHHQKAPLLGLQSGPFTAHCGVREMLATDIVNRQLRHEQICGRWISCSQSK